MIGALVLTLPILAILAYGALEIRRAPIVGGAIVVLTLVAVAFIWLPNLATATAERLQLGSANDLIMVTWVGLVTVILLNLHLRLRRQTQAVTLLTRQIALSGRSGWQDLAGPATLDDRTRATRSPGTDGPPRHRLRRGEAGQIER